MPDGRKVTCLKIVSANKPHERIKERIHATVGGDRVDYPGEDTSNKTSDLVTVKLLLNSTSNLHP